EIARRSLIARVTRATQCQKRAPLGEGGAPLDWSGSNPRGSLLRDGVDLEYRPLHQAPGRDQVPQKLRPMIACRIKPVGFGEVLPRLDHHPAGCDAVGAINDLANGLLRERQEFRAHAALSALSGQPWLNTTGCPVPQSLK